MNEFSRSEYLTDHLTRNHPRFQNFSRNMRLRRGNNPESNLPLFKDTHTDMEKTLPFEKYPGKVTFDSFAAGMMNSSFQMTFAAKNLSEARWATDQMGILSYMMLPFGVCTPVFKNKLVDVDSRLLLLADSCDDRKPSELAKKHITNSRVGPVRLFISEDKRNRKEYNDLPFNINKRAKKYAKNFAKKIGVSIDSALLNHLSWLCHKESISTFGSGFKYLRSLAI